MTKNCINVAVVGATGYVGLDLVYLLSKHPKVKIVNLCAQKNIGKKIRVLDKRLKNSLPNICKVKSVDWKNIDELIPKNFQRSSENKKTGKAGIFAGSLELVKEGNLTIKQNKLFDDVFIKEINE